MFKPLKSHHSSQRHSPELATMSDLAEGGEPLGPKLAESSRGGLLGFLRARPKPVGDTFRTNPRRKSSIRARLSWRHAGKPREVPARLINISRAGAALIANTPPPEAAAVLVRLMGVEPTPWIEADVLGVEPDARGRNRVRVRFREFCPDYFLKAAVLDPLMPREEPSPSSPAPNTAS